MVLWVEHRALVLREPGSNATVRSTWAINVWHWVCAALQITSFTPSLVTWVCATEHAPLFDDYENTLKLNKYLWINIYARATRVLHDGTTRWHSVSCGKRETVAQLHTRLVHHVYMSWRWQYGVYVASVLVALTSTFIVRWILSDSYLFIYFTLRVLSTSKRGETIRCIHT